ncbi:DUF1758 domain-containing protein [Trichonephila clavipes]|nr:DUF1758 domain-containing protein [Trichonephila clavipes]
MPRTKRFGQAKRRLIRSNTSVNAESERVDVSASKKKIEKSEVSFKDYEDNFSVETQSRYIIIDLNMLNYIFNNIAKCRYCDKSFCFDVAGNKSSRKGLATSVSATCKYCGSGHTSMTSNTVSDGYEVNLRFVYGMRCIGIGKSAAQIFCAPMNLPPPPAKFERLYTPIFKALETVSSHSMRIGARLRALKNNLKSTKQSDNKPISGRGRLTDAKILLLQKYYGLAIRRNVGKSVADMSKSIWVIYFHKLSTDENPQHALCPMGEESWCGYNKSIVSAKFCSFCVIENVPVLLKAVDSKHTIKDYQPVKILGIAWLPDVDEFTFTITVNETDVWTKRKVLSDVAKIFDPLGWLAPHTHTHTSVIISKIFLQELWSYHLSWGEELPDSLARQWRVFQDQLPLLTNIKIPRCILIPQAIDVQVHGFCDSSEKAYWAVIYIRSKDATQTVVSRLLTSKTRVSSVKPQSLPRLELCSALLLVNLLQATLPTLTVPISETLAWSDSKITLAWLKSEPRR